MPLREVSSRQSSRIWAEKKVLVRDTYCSTRYGAKATARLCSFMLVQTHRSTGERRKNTAHKVRPIMRRSCFKWSCERSSPLHEGQYFCWFSTCRPRTPKCARRLTPKLRPWRNLYYALFKRRTL